MSLCINDIFFRRNKLRDIESLLETVKSTQNYGKRKKELNDFSAVVGYTSNTFGLNGFGRTSGIRHNMIERNHLGVCVTDPLLRKSVPGWLKKLWVLVKEILLTIDDEFFSGNFFFSYSFSHFFLEESMLFMYRR